jgi:hypothetical protein
VSQFHESNTTNSRLGLSSIFLPFFASATALTRSHNLPPFGNEIVIRTDHKKCSDLLVIC